MYGRCSECGAFEGTCACDNPFNKPGIREMIEYKEQGFMEWHESFKIPTRQAVDVVQYTGLVACNVSSELVNWNHVLMYRLSPVKETKPNEHTEGWKKAQHWREVDAQQTADKLAVKGVKFDDKKPRMDLIDGEALDELAQVLTFGAAKYEPDNWRKGIKLSRLLAASMRHLVAIMRGETYDEETGLQHAAHLMCCAMFIIWTLKHRKDMDDRWKNNPTSN